MPHLNLNSDILHYYVSISLNVSINFMKTTSSYILIAQKKTTRNPSFVFDYFFYSYLFFLYKIKGTYLTHT